MEKNLLRALSTDKQEFIGVIASLQAQVDNLEEQLAQANDELKQLKTKNNDTENNHNKIITELRAENTEIKVKLAEREQAITNMMKSEEHIVGYNSV